MMRDTIASIGYVLLVGAYWAAGGFYCVGLYATAKYDTIGMFLFTLCVPLFGQLYGAWVGFGFVFLGAR